MQIIFSRHAKRRAKLYDIPTSVVTDAIKETRLSDGRQEIVRKVVDLKYPLKIVLEVTGNIVTIITTYPLKKGLRL